MATDSLPIEVTGGWKTLPDDITFHPRDLKMTDYHREALDRDDVAACLFTMGSHEYMHFLVKNFHELIGKPVYTELFVNAYTGVQFNTRKIEARTLELLFSLVDRDKARAIFPSPVDLPEKIYRGVSGHGRARRIRGYSWTGDIEKAKWFATRYPLFSPAVLEVDPSGVEIVAYSNDRKEDEYICVVPDDVQPKTILKLEAKVPMP